MDEIEGDPEMRQHINLYKRDDFRPEDLNDADDSTFQGLEITELLENLNLNDS